jgi:uncharacterized membrane protein YbhN (UPF0104 family)
MSEAAVRRRAPGTVWAWVKVLGGLAILAILVWRVGTGGFLEGLRVTSAGTLLAATGIGLLTTLFNAWRWCLVARGLGIPLRLPGAVADYYRALFLNAALPGGVLGDVHRAVGHGRHVGDLGLGVRSVILERSAGQVVVVAVGLLVLLVSPAPPLSLSQVVTVPPAVAVVAAVVVLAVVLMASRRLWRATSRWGRAWRAAITEVRRTLLSRRVWPGIVLTSTAALAGYLATFLVAARAAGVTAPTLHLLPLLMLALLAMTIPLNVGGWGPREGVCAWAFGMAGLGTTQGLTVAVVYGVSVLVASAPGAGVLAFRWFAERRPVGQLTPIPAPNRSDSA